MSDKDFDTKHIDGEKIDATLKREHVAERSTEVQHAEMPRTSFKDVRATFRAFCSSKADEIKQFARTHPRAALLLAALVLIACGLLAFVSLRAQDLPKDEDILVAARQNLQAPGRAQGPFDAPENLVLAQLDVVSKTRSSSALEPQDALFGASSYAAVKLSATYGNGAVEAQKQTSYSFAKVDGSWSTLAREHDTSLSYIARKGISDEAILQNVALILAQADADAGSSSDDPNALVNLYAGASATMLENSFNEEEQSDKATFTIASGNQFAQHKAQITANFSFRPVNGSWDLESVEVSDAAKQLNFDALIGTWAGTFMSTESGGEKSFGARQHPLSLTVDSIQGAQDGVVKMNAHISVLAHWHPYPKQNVESSEGETMLDKIPVTLTLSTERDPDLDSKLVFSGDLPEMAEGKLHLAIGFGTDADATQVIARATSTYRWEHNVLFLPMVDTLTYTDVYNLVKE